MPHHSIEDVSKCPADFFLCTTQFYGLLLNSESDSDCTDSGHSRLVTEGEVLRKSEISTINHNIIPPRFRKLSKDGRFLLCVDEKDMEIYIPLTQTGLFYEVSDGDIAKSNNCVLQILDILDEMIALPVYVRHILGDPPPVSQFYSPCLKLDRLVEEETLMGCTLDRGDLLPFEIQTNSPIKFEISLNIQKLQGTVDYAEAFNLCRNIGRNYVTDMKLAVTFCQVNPINLEPQGEDNETFQSEDNQCSLSASQRTSTSVDNDGQSEEGEVDALSEFSIQWDPGPRSPVSLELASSSPSEKDSDCNSIELAYTNTSGLVCDKDMHKPVLEDNVRLWQQTQCINKSNRKEIHSKFSFDSDIEDMPPVLTPVWTWKESPNNTTDKKAIKTHILHKNDLNTPTYYDADSEPSSLSNITIESTSFRTQSDEEYVYNTDDSFALQMNGTGNYSYTGDVYINYESDDDNVSISDISTCSGPSHGSSSERTLILTPSSSKSQSLSSVKEEEPVLNPWLELERQRKKAITQLHELSESEKSQIEQEDEIERKWSKFCFERTLSLPTRPKTHETKSSHIKEHSNSWEQVSPRAKNKLLDMSVVSGGLHAWTPRSMRRYNSDFAGYGDRTQLISDTSSEDSIPITTPNKVRIFKGGKEITPKIQNNNSSYYSEESDHNFQNSKFNVEQQNNKTFEEQNKTNIIAQILMLKDEMKMKPNSEWNEISEII